MTTTLKPPADTTWTCAFCPGVLSDAKRTTCACAHETSPEAPSPATGLDGAGGPPPPAPVDPEAQLRAAGIFTRTLTELAETLHLLDEALGAWAEHAPLPELLAALGTLGRDGQVGSGLRGMRGHLATLEASVEARCARTMTEDRFELPDGRVAERRGGGTYKKWQHAAVAHRVAEKAADGLALNAETGEYDDALARAVHAGVEALLAAARPEWRTTALRKAEVRFDDLVDVEYGRRTVTLSPGGEG